jgi:hypothetical protein
VAQKAIVALPQYALPPLGVKRAIQPGDQVMLCMLRAQDIPECDIWVRVNLVKPGDLFTGEIIAAVQDESVPFVGQEVVFTANHIALIDRPNFRSVPN